MTWFERWRGLSWDPPGEVGWLFFLLAFGVVAYAIFLYRHNDAPLTRGMRTLLVGLRAVALLVLVAILARPVLSLAVPGGAARGVLVLADRSASMGLPGAAPGTTREDELLRSVESVRLALESSYPLVTRGFDAGLGAPFDARSPQPATGAVTDLAAALELGLAEGGTLGRPGAMVLVSDGTQTTGADPIPLARRMGVPLHVVGLGSPRPVSDLSLTRIRVNREAFLGERTPLEAVIRLQGLSADSVEVTLLDVTEEPVSLATERIAVRAMGAEQRVALVFTPRETGLRFLEVRVSTLEGEATHINNRRLAAIEVREEKTGILFLSGRMTWDHSFLRRALEADSTLEVTAAFWKDRQFTTLRTGEAAPALDANGLREVRVVVLDHVDPDQLGADGMQAVAGFCRAGGGLLLVSGGSSGALSSWAGTPIEELLPVRINDTGVGGELSARLTPQARRHVLFDPAVPGAAPLEAWNDLPPLAVAPSLGPVKGAAEAFLTAPGPAEPLPVLSWMRVGGGRSVLLAAGGAWKWDFASSAHRPAGNVMPGWWRRTLHWLARPDVETRLDIHPEEPVVGRGRAVTVVGRVTDDAYQPIPGTRVEVDVEPMPGVDAESRRVTLTGSEGFFSGDVAGLPPGRYRYTGRASAGSNSLGTVEGVFAVDSLGAEMERLEADHELLTRLAQAGGGAFWSPDSLHGLPATFRTLEREGEERLQVAVWDHPLLFTLFVLAASMEWLLRRRRGLV